MLPLCNVFGQRRRSGREGACSNLAAAGGGFNASIPFCFLHNWRNKTPLQHCGAVARDASEAKDVHRFITAAAAELRSHLLHCLDCSEHTCISKCQWECRLWNYLLTRAPSSQPSCHRIHHLLRWGKLNHGGNLPAVSLIFLRQTALFC